MRAQDPAHPAATPAPAHRVELATWPTPLEAAPRLAGALGLTGALWLKRDDLTGLGAGGNKLRKLEWTVGAALAEGADVLVTTGAAQSNHARLTAAAAARVGVDVVLVLQGGPPAQARGNLVLEGLLGATVVWTDDLRGDPADPPTTLEAAAQTVLAELGRRGRTPALVPFGGSNATGAHGYRLAGEEIVGQLPSFDHVVCAVGSGGTMAGLVSALGPATVLGVHTGAVDDPRAQVSGLLTDMGEHVDPDLLRVRADQVGQGYDTLAPGAAEALRLAARTEGVVLDPVYSARALAGLHAALRDGDVAADDTVVFLASGGLPGLFGHDAASSRYPVGGDLDALTSTDPTTAAGPTGS